jgi:hypothetical protein
MRLRNEFAFELLAETQLRIEALRGGGRVMVIAAQLQVVSTTIRRRAVRPPRPKPTSFSLINQAEASGALNKETALLYRVYSLFGDARLPAQYRGDDRKVFDSRYMGVVRQRFSTLSPTTQAAVQPFLIPPAYKGSWTNTKAGSDVTALGAPPSPCQGLGGNWVFVDAATVPVRMWYRLDVAGDGEIARSLGVEIDRTIWPKLIGLMAPSGGTTGVPLSDDKEQCNGGDGRLDVYVVDEIAVAGLTMEYKGCSNTPAFIELNRSYGRGVAAHEIFHAIQYSYAVNPCEQYDWWSEASATWAEDFVYPHDQSEQDHAAAYLDAPEIRLDFTDSGHEYGAYLLPFYVHRTTGSADFVRVAWELCTRQPPLEAVDKAIGGFDKQWREFAKYNWNQKPWDDYKQWDALTSSASTSGLKLRTSTGTAVYDIEYELPPLSASYHHIVFSDDDSSVVFWNGVTHKLKQQSTECCGVGYVAEPLSGDETKGAHVWAMIRKGDAWSRESWTERPFVKFCRDLLSERIDELVLVISNSEYKNPDRKLKPPGLAPVVYTSNIGCAKWEGTSTFTHRRVDLDSTLTISAKMTWTPADLQLEQSSLIFYRAQGTQNWSVSGQCSGSGTLPIQSEFSALLTFNFIPPESTFSRAYAGYGTDAGQDATVNCGPRGVHTISLDAWFQPPPQPVVPGIRGARIVKVKENGKIIDDTDHPSETETSTWHFEAKRQQ